MFRAKWKYPSKTPTYYSWKAMRARCGDEKHAAWKRYGGRGIIVCVRWRENYDAFYEDMGPRPLGMTLERMDNDQGYDPFNCVWATRAQQALNRGTNRIIRHNGKAQTITEWAAEIGLSVSGIKHRLCQGIPIESVLSPERRKLITVPHGSLSRYTNQKCRCKLCRNAANEYSRQWKAKRREYS